MTIPSLIWEAISGQFLPYIIAGVVALGAYFKGRKDVNAKRDAKEARADREAHERMNDADLGVGATDSERIERLREFSAKHGNRSSEGGGR